MASVKVAAHVRKNPKTGKLELVKQYIRQTGGEAAARKKGVDVDALKRIATKADKGLIPNAEFRAKFSSLKSPGSAQVPSADAKKAVDKLKEGKPQLTGDTKVVNGKKMYKLTNGQWTDDPTKFVRQKGFGKIHLSAEESDLLLSQVAEDFEPSSVDMLELGALERAPGKNDNWVESNGGLPKYIEEIAKDLHAKRGMTISRAIATAVSRCKVWAAGGGGVKPDTKAKAAAAIAQWEALKAKGKAKTG